MQQIEDNEWAHEKGRWFDRTEPQTQQIDKAVEGEEAQESRKQDTIGVYEWANSKGY